MEYSAQVRNGEMENRLSDTTVRLDLIFAWKSKLRHQMAADIYILSRMPLRRKDIDAIRRLEFFYLTLTHVAPCDAAISATYAVQENMSKSHIKTPNCAIPAEPPFSEPAPRHCSAMTYSATPHEIPLCS